MPSYLYGVVAAGTPPPDEPGLGGEPVEVVPVGDRLAVLRSEVDADAVEPRRRFLAAHDRVLAAAMAAGPVLPLRFGIVTDMDAAALADDLDAEAAERRMHELQGHVEVQVLWELDEDAALPRVVEADPSVRSEDRSPVDRGQRVAELLSTLAQQDLREIVTRLDGATRATGPVEPRGTNGARAALLVPVEAVEELEATADRLARRAAEVGRLRTVAGLPPYSFADTDAPLGGS